MTANTPRGTAPTQYDGSGSAVDAQTNVITDGHTVFLVFHAQATALVTPEIIDAGYLQDKGHFGTAPTGTIAVFGGILSPLLLRSRPDEERNRPA
jgi:hypothetical protein